MALSEDFNTASSNLDREMRILRELPYPDFPLLEPEKWGSFDNNNCYNFALNRPSKDYLLPGTLSGCPEIIRSSLEEFADCTHRYAISDGVRSLGGSLLGFRDGETPAALFFCFHSFNQKKDFHWLAMRVFQNELIWAGKPGHKPTEICKSIFEKAAADNYKYFAGYYAVPRRLSVFSPSSL